MRKSLLLFTLLGVRVLLAGEDLGVKVAEYAIRDGKKIWERRLNEPARQYHYDTNGQLTRVTIEDRQENAFTYGASGYLDSQKDALNNTIYYKYDDRYRLNEVRSASGSLKYTYDKYGRLSFTEGVDTLPQTFQFNSWGDLSELTDGNSISTRMSYDDNGQLTERIMPDASIHKYTYKNGKLHRKIVADRMTTFNYDKYGRLTEETVNLGDVNYIRRMTYDENGNLVSISDDKGTIRFEYDAFGLLILEEGPVGTLKMRYNAGRLAAVEARLKKTKEIFTTEYFYDETGRLIKVTSPSGAFEYLWGSTGELLGQVVKGRKIENRYDAVGRLIRKEIDGEILARYEYDDCDRRISAQYFDLKWRYEYDRYSQLIAADDSRDRHFRYQYDPAGNRILWKENEKERSLSYNVLNQISDEQYRYDAWGNLIRIPEACYTYDLKDRLVSVILEDGTKIEYEYDPAGQRVASTVNGHRREFLMSSMVEYARISGADSYFHTLGLDILNSVEKTGMIGGVLATNQTAYLYDGNGNVIANLTNGEIGGKTFYDPFGNRISKECPLFGFSSKSMDESGLVYYGHRFYLPKLGIWNRPDPLMEMDVMEKISDNYLTGKSKPKGKYIGYNFYSFVGNQPVSKVDYIGLWPCNSTQEAQCESDCKTKISGALGNPVFFKYTTDCSRSIKWEGWTCRFTDPRCTCITEGSVNQCWQQNNGKFYCEINFYGKTKEIYDLPARLSPGSSFGFRWEWTF